METVLINGERTSKPIIVVAFLEVRQGIKVQSPGRRGRSIGIHVVSGQL